MDTLSKPSIIDFKNGVPLKHHALSSLQITAKYRHLIKWLLSEHATLLNAPSKGNVETYLVFDEARDHYILYRLGWWRGKRVSSPGFYVRLHNDKIWIEEDRSEEGLAPDLLAAGVPREHIVLAFHHPSMRPFTEFAAA